MTEESMSGLGGGKPRWAENYVERCSGHMRESEVNPANLHDLAWCNECFRSVYLRTRHIATTTEGT